MGHINAIAFVFMLMVLLFLNPVKSDASPYKSVIILSSKTAGDVEKNIAGLLIERLKESGLHSSNPGISHDIQFA